MTRFLIDWQSLIEILILVRLLTYREIDNISSVIDTSHHKHHPNHGNKHWRYNRSIEGLIKLLTYWWNFTIAVIEIVNCEFWPNSVPQKSNMAAIKVFCAWQLKFVQLVTFIPRKGYVMGKIESCYATMWEPIKVDKHGIRIFDKKKKKLITIIDKNIIWQNKCK